MPLLSVWRWWRFAWLVLCLAGIAACSSKGGPGGPKTRPPPLVTVAKIEARDVRVEVRAPVDLRPLAQADVGAKSVGYLDAVLVERGDLVKRGQVVALVRPSDLPDQLAQARGSLAQTQATLALAQANHERARQLASSGLVSQQDLQQAAAALASAKASETEAKAQIGVFGVRLGETRIESPLDGVVVARRLDPGALVGAAGAGPIVTVARVDTMRVFISVGERKALGLAVGQEATIELDALPGKSFVGKVVRLAPTFDPTTRTLDAEVQLDNPNGELRPGMFGRGAITLEVHAGAPVVAAAAVSLSDGRRYIFVVDGDKVRRREIQTGVDGGTWLEVKGGLTVGEEVVVAGADTLSEGSTIRASREGDRPKAKADPGVPAPSSAPLPVSSKPN